MDRSDPGRSGGLWLLSAAVTAGAALCGHFSWASALLGGVLGLLAVRFARPSGTVTVLQTAWLAAPLCVAANGASALFPGGIYVPAVVLGLAWLLACHSREGVLCCCAIIGFFVLGAIGVVSMFCLPDLRFAWLRPTLSLDEVLIALAVGSGGTLLARAVPEAKPGSGWRWAAAMAPAILAALVSGGLSRPLAARQASAFYSLSRAVSLFGVAERFEALLAACLMMGLCSVCTLMLRAASGEGRVRAVLVLAALVLTQVRVPPLVLSGGTVLFWVVQPLLPPKKTAQKNFEKDEKSS